MTSDNIKAGDIVKVRSTDSPKMTVEYVETVAGERKVASCIWFAGAELRREQIGTSALELLRSA